MGKESLPVVHSIILGIVSTGKNTNNLSFFVGLQHQDNAIIELVANIIYSTFGPMDLATRNTSSEPNITADNSFLGTVAFNNLDFEATSAQLQVESFNFLPEYTAAPPALIAASVTHISLIPEIEPLSAGIHILGIDNVGKSTNLDN